MIRPGYRECRHSPLSSASTTSLHDVAKSQTRPIIVDTSNFHDATVVCLIAKGVPILQAMPVIMDINNFLDVTDFYLAA